MSHPPSVVVFDLGKVLLDFDYSIVVRRLAARSKASLEELDRLLLSSPLLPAYERGEMTSAEFFTELAARARFDGSFEEFAGYFADIFTEIPPMISLHKGLRARGLPTYIFSNTNDLAIQHIRRNFPFFGRFNGYVLSYEHRVMKPDAPIYDVVEQLAGARAADLLYLDDRPENIETGNRRGWQTILHRDPDETLSRIRDMGML